MTDGRRTANTLSLHQQLKIGEYLKARDVSNIWIGDVLKEINSFFDFPITEYNLRHIVKELDITLRTTQRKPRANSHYVMRSDITALARLLYSWVKNMELSPQEMEELKTLAERRDRSAPL